MLQEQKKPAIAHLGNNRPHLTQRSGHDFYQGYTGTHLRKCPLYF